MESLVEYIEASKTVQTHEDIPTHIRQELYVAARQASETHKITTGAAHPVTVNVLPASTCQNCSASAADVESKKHFKHVSITPLDIPGFLDEHVVEYCAWQQSHVQSSAWKADCIKACDVMIKNAMDLNLLHADRNPQFLIDAEVLKVLPGEL